MDVVGTERPNGREEGMREACHEQREREVIDREREHADPND
jgi:hypothetical protein